MTADLLKTLEQDGPVKVKAFPNLQKVFNNKVFPLVFVPKSEQPSVKELVNWATKSQSGLMELIRSYGAVLFRGFTCLASPKEFNDFVEATGVEALPYVGGAAPRTNVYKGVFTSNESPPSEPIPFHHEMAQVPTYPSYIYFYAETPSKSGGATPILRSDVLYETINERYPDFAKRLEEKGVIYSRVLPADDDPTSAIGRGWKSTFLTDDKEIAKQKAKSLNVTLEWLPNGNVESVSSVLPAIKPYKHDPKRKVFFNSMIAAYTGWRDSRNNPEKAVKYGDGSPLEPDMITAISNIMEEICVDMLWEQNDLICIDNNLVMHARRSFEPPRRLLAYVAK